MSLQSQRPSGRPDVRGVGIAETVAGILRRRILEGEYHDGAMLPKQEQLRSEFQISHPTLREALRILETEGLITVRRGNLGGAFVHLPDAGSAAYALGLAMQATEVTLTDLAAALRIIEPACVRLCAEREDRLEAVVPQLEEANRQSDGFVHTDIEFTTSARRFHELFPLLCGNSTLRIVAHALGGLWSAQEEQWVHGMSVGGEAPDLESRREVVEYHRRMTELIAEGNGPEAERLSRAHLRATQEFMFAHHADTVIESQSVPVQTHLRSFSKRI